jgi:chromosome partitioning protein
MSTKEKSKGALVIGVVNQKGGVGKTTTTAHLGYYLARQGKRVLLIDTDAQGNLGSVLGVQDIQTRRALYHFIVGKLPLEDVVVHTREGMCLDVVVSNKLTKELEAYVMGKVFAGSVTTVPSIVLHRAFEAYKGEYDVFIVDAPPTVNLMHTNVIAMADTIIVPTRLEFLSAIGVAEVLNTIVEISEQPGMEPPELLGVLPFQYNIKTPNENKRILVEIAKVILDGSQLILPPIPKTIRAAEASRAGLTVFEFEPEATCIVGYKKSDSGKNSLGLTGGYLHLGEIVEAKYF